MFLVTECPGCHAPLQTEVAVGAAGCVCESCQRRIEFPADAWEGDTLRRCLVCPCEELFVRKDFPQRLGATIVLVGFALSFLAMIYYRLYLAWGILFATAGVDLLLYLLMPNALACYRCQARYRSGFVAAGAAAGRIKSAGHAPFDLAVHERYRQEAARLAEQQAARSAEAGKS